MKEKSFYLKTALKYHKEIILESNYECKGFHQN